MAAVIPPTLPEPRIIRFASRSKDHQPQHAGPGLVRLTPPQLEKGAEGQALLSGSLAKIITLRSWLGGSNKGALRGEASPAQAQIQDEAQEELQPKCYVEYPSLNLNDAQPQTLSSSDESPGSGAQPPPYADMEALLFTDVTADTADKRPFWRRRASNKKGRKGRAQLDNQGDTELEPRQNITRQRTIFPKWWQFTSPTEGKKQESLPVTAPEVKSQDDNDRGSDNSSGRRWWHLLTKPKNLANALPPQPHHQAATRLVTDETKEPKRVHRSWRIRKRTKGTEPEEAPTTYLEMEAAIFASDASIKSNARQWWSFHSSANSDTVRSTTQFAARSDGMQFDTSAGQPGTAAKIVAPPQPLQNVPNEDNQDIEKVLAVSPHDVNNRSEPLSFVVSEEDLRCENAPETDTDAAKAPYSPSPYPEVMASVGFEPRNDLSPENRVKKARRRRYVIAGLATLGSVVVGLSSWRLLSPIDVPVLAPGTWSVEVRRHNVIGMDTVQMGSLLVQEGDHVAAGAPLVLVAGRQSGKQAVALLSQIDSARTSLVLLRAQQMDDASVPIDESIMERMRNDPAFSAAIEAQRSISAARRASADQQVAILNARIHQIRNEIFGLIAQDRSRAAHIDTLRRELDMVLELLRGGNATRPRAFGLEREIARLEGVRGEQNVGVSQLEQSIGQIELQILQIRHSLSEDYATRLEAAFTQMANADAQTLHIRTPVSGIIANITVPTTDSLIMPGQLLMQIIPDDGELLLISTNVQTNLTERLPISGRNIVPGRAVEIVVRTEKGTMLGGWLASLKNFLYFGSQ